MRATSSRPHSSQSPWGTPDGRDRTDDTARSRSAAHRRPPAVETWTISARCALVLVAMLLAVAPDPAVAATSPCAGVRFLVEPAFLPASTLPFDAIVVGADGSATIADCGAARVRVTHRGTVASVHARWS